jgi:hypothetical protein
MTTRENEDHVIAEAIRAARTVQEFLWGESNGAWGFEEWKRMFRKRAAKIDEVKRDNPHAAVELRKRLLQQAALSIALIRIVERNGGIPWEASVVVESNLPQYALGLEETLDKAALDAAGRDK